MRGAGKTETGCPPDEVEGVLAGLLDEAWDRTEEALLEIPAQKADGMRVAPVSGVAFNARCDYLGRTIELNIDPTLTRPGLKHLAVHEGYPGHYVQFKLRETLYREGAAPADVLLSVVNTASSSVFEGIADAGMEMMDWIDSDDDRVLALLNRHRAGIGTGAAWRLHALGWAGRGSLRLASVPEPGGWGRVGGQPDGLHLRSRPGRFSSGPTGGVSRWWHRRGDGFPPPAGRTSCASCTAECTRTRTVEMFDLKGCAGWRSDRLDCGGLAFAAPGRLRLRTKAAEPGPGGPAAGRSFASPTSEKSTS